MIYFAICLVLFSVYYLNKKKGIDSLAPNQLFSLYWLFQILMIVPMCGFLSWNYSGLIFVCIAVVAFSLFFRYGFGKEDECKRNIKCIGEKKYIYMVLLFTGMGMLLYLVNTFYMYNISLEDALFNFSVISRKLYDLRNMGEGEKTTVVSTVSRVLLYAFPLLAGYYHNTLKNKYVFIFGFLIITYTSFLYSTKMMLISSVIFWISGWLISCKEDGREINKDILFKLFAGLTGLIVVLTISMFVRALSTINITLDESFIVVYKNLANYGFAHLLAFDHWFTDFVWNNFTGGQYTFFGIFNTIGLASREPGVFIDFFCFGELRTNVYTVFRMLVTDYSPIGAVVFVAVCGYFIGKFYKRVIIANNPCPLAVTICVMTYAFILWSFATSVFAYASFICAFVYFYLCQKFIIWRSGC